MREIKFRGKSKNVNEWCYGTYIFTNDNTNNPFRTRPFKESHRIVFWCSGDWNMGGWVDEEVIPETIGQYTGLKDKNDKEIYEGDIVEWVFFYEKLGANMGVKECDTIVKGIIRWRQGGFILEVTENDFENAGYYSISALYTDTESDVEIIGNIYVDPELIKEEQK